jgi:hypothetical protein
MLFGYLFRTLLVRLVTHASAAPQAIWPTPTGCLE